MKIFEIASRLIAEFYSLTNSYALAIGLVAVVVMLLITPLTLKSTKGMLEMQKLQPEMRRLQAEFKGDRQKLNEAMMKLYQGHKVNPLASCLPILAQMPVFIIMFRALQGLIHRPDGDGTAFVPKYLDQTSELYNSLLGKTEMISFGLDLSQTPIDAVNQSFGKGMIYVGLVALLAGLYFVQQKMVASRTVSPTMSASQAKIMQYLPVVFAVFQLFLPTGLIFYYMVQAIIRIIQQFYITKRFYGNDSSLGRQAQAASEQARDMSKNDKAAEKKNSKPTTKPDAPFESKRVTPPKGKSSGTSRRPQAPGKNRSGSVARRPKP
jgi:YidC/Oxa1 family membrane protein insertase